MRERGLRIAGHKEGGWVNRCDTNTGRLEHLQSKHYASSSLAFGSSSLQYVNRNKTTKQTLILTIKCQKINKAVHAFLRHSYLTMLRTTHSLLFSYMCFLVQ